MSLDKQRVRRCLVGFSCLFSAIAIAGSGFPENQEIESPGEVLGKSYLRTGDLCQKLSEIQPGQVVPIEAAGLYFNGMAWDPLTPECEYDVQPTVFVEFSPEIREVPTVRRLAERRMPTMIAYRGELHGPPLLGVDDTKASPMIAYLQRVADRGYGPRNIRVKLIIYEILSEREEYPTYPDTNAVNRTPKPTLIRQMSLPEYQYQAWFAGLEGEVVVEIRLGEGKVKASRLVSGDRLLAIETFDHLKTWLVDPERTDTFTVTYSYNLELRRSEQHREPRVILDLPRRIEIWAAKNGWN